MPLSALTISTLARLLAQGSAEELRDAGIAMLCGFALLWPGRRSAAAG